MHTESSPVSSYVTFTRLDAATALIVFMISFSVILSLFVGDTFLLLFVSFASIIPVVWRFPQAGFLAMLLLLMIFGDKFSLLPIIIDGSVYKLYALDILIIINFLCFFFQLKREALVHTFTKPSPQTIALILFVLMLCFQTVRSIVFSSAETSLIIGSFKNYAYLLTYFLFLGLFKTAEDIRQVAKTLFFGGLFISIFVAYGFLHGKGLWSDLTPGLRYLSGLHTYYLMFSLVPLTLFLAEKRLSLTTLSFFLFQFTGLLASMFRHLWVGFFCAITIIFAHLAPVKRRQLFVRFVSLLSVSILIIAFFFWASQFTNTSLENFHSTLLDRFQERVGTLTQTGDDMEDAAGWRVAVWTASAASFLEHPLLGVGLGQKIAFSFGGVTNTVELRSIHNDIVGLFTQIGIVGSALFIIFNLFQWRTFQRVFHANKEFHLLTLSLLGLWTISLVGMFFALYLIYSATSIFYWTLMGMLTVLNHSVKS